MRLLTFDELKRQKGVPYCRDHLRRLVKAGDFPQPIEIGARRIAWNEAEVDEHLEALAAQRSAPKPAPQPEPEPPPKRPRKTGGRHRAAQ